MTHSEAGGGPSLKLNYVYNMAYQLLKLLTPLISTPYLSRILSPEGVGYYSYTYSVANMFFLVAVLGMENYGVRLIASAGDDRRKRSHDFWGAYFAQLLVGAVALIGYALFACFIEPDYLPINILWIPWILSAMVDVSWLFFGMQDFKAPTLRSCAVKLLTLIAIFVFVESQDDLWAYVLISSCGPLVEQLTLWPFLKTRVDRYHPKAAEVAAHIAPNARLFIPVIAINCYTTLDKIILGNLSNNAQVGYFEYAEKMSRMPLTVITALGTVALPKMSKVWEAGDDETAYLYIDKSVWLVLTVAFAFMFGIIAIAPEFVPVFFGDGYDSCIELMSVLSLIIPAISLTNVLGAQYLLPNFRDNSYALSVALAAAVNVALNLILIPELSALGAAIAMVAAEYTVLIVQLVVVRGELSFLSAIGRNLFCVIPGLAMVFVLRVSSSFFVGIWGLSAATVISEFVVGACVYAALIIVWNAWSNNPYYFELLGQLKRRLRIRGQVG